MVSVLASLVFNVCTTGCIDDYNYYKWEMNGHPAAQLCSSVSEAISSSSNLKAELRSLLVTAQARKAEEHDKVTAAIAGSLQETQTHKVCIEWQWVMQSAGLLSLSLSLSQQTLILEKGQVRMAQNTMLHQRHSEEIALGIAQGPVSDKHR